MFGTRFEEISSDCMYTLVHIVRRILHHEASRAPPQLGTIHRNTEKTLVNQWLKALWLKHPARLWRWLKDLWLKLHGCAYGLFWFDPLVGS